MFGVVSWIGPGMGILDLGGDRPRGRGNLEVFIRLRKLFNELQPNLYFHER